MKKTKTTLYDFLKDEIPKEDLEKINRSFEIVGDIAITEIPLEVEKYEKKIGEAIMKVNPSIKVVLKKSGIHEGEFRTQELKNIAGENRKETIYTENNIKLKINPQTVYFSSKLSTEREQLMSEIEDNSRILVMFSGCGPYSYVALRKNPDIGRITSIELNPQGHKYAIESLELNKNIIKKSQIYDNLIGFLNTNQIPAIEKILRKNLNYLKLNFINGDVKEEIDKLTLSPISNINSQTQEDNELFYKNHPRYVFDQINESNKKTYNLNFDKLKDPEDLIPFLILYGSKLDFNIQIKNQIYSFNTQYKKSLLFNYLENECKIPIEKIHLFDEIFMPLPKDAEMFLEEAFKIAAKDAKIHMYDFVHDNEFPHETEKKVIEAGKKYGKEIEIIQTRKVGQYAPKKFRVCCDFIVR